MIQLWIFAAFNSWPPLAQGFELEDPAAHCPEAWNSLNKRPMSQWLMKDAEEDFRPRMTMLGNQVIPAQAKLGFETVLRMRRQARQWRR